jgi:hypothetical protein
MTYVSRMLAIREYGGHQDLRGSDHQSIIPYVYGRMRVVLLKCWLFLSVALSGLPELGLRAPSPYTGICLDLL